ncbi:unnamed protein product [Fraxinus pennsylvanica]|uniref:Replication protein n=1 Tax=Fraxinus pennsylvanica TaxID=56036 RepID=A0AAD2E0M4_9LAMI|nr:unnamed protein product [Fraxinus pennsylvanica]
MDYSCVPDYQNNPMRTEPWLFLTHVSSFVNRSKGGKGLLELKGSNYNIRGYPIGEKSTAFCRQCNIQDVSYIRRYLLKFIVSDDYTEVVITLFDAAESLAGCSVVEYAKEVFTKKEKSGYYRNLVLIEDKEYKFLVKMDKKGQSNRDQKQIVVQEVYKTVNGGKKIEEVRSHHLDKKMKLEK